MESSTSSDEGSLKSKEVNDGKDPNPVGACLDMITKRKQQCESVEAILNNNQYTLISEDKPAHCCSSEGEIDGNPWYYDINNFIQNQVYPLGASKERRKP